HLALGVQCDIKCPKGRLLQSSPPLAGGGAPKPYGAIRATGCQGATVGGEEEVVHCRQYGNELAVICVPQSDRAAFLLDRQELVIIREKQSSSTFGARQSVSLPGSGYLPNFHLPGFVGTGDQAIVRRKAQENRHEPRFLLQDFPLLGRGYIPDLD